LLAPPLAGSRCKFGPAEYFSLMLLGLVIAVVLAQGSMLKALGDGGARHPARGSPDRTSTPAPSASPSACRNSPTGFDFLALSMGIFGLGEIVRNLETDSPRIVTAKPCRPAAAYPRGVDLASSRPSCAAPASARLLGILPGGGAVLASFVSYTLEKRVSKRPKKFGTGMIEGVAGPESANNAGAQTSFIPMLTLGIPSNPVMALMIAALILQGIQPGPNVMTAARNCSGASSPRCGSATCCWSCSTCRWSASG
jgi:putative tricarboxylic transport membrane protein